MAYTIRINTYFTKFNRVKVLLYDQAYHIKQAQFNTPWGIDIGFLKDNYLLDGDLETTRSQQKHTATDKPITFRSDDKPRRVPGSSQEVCQMFNQYSGCRFCNRCIHQHICEDCRCRHPKYAHTAPITR